MKKRVISVMLVLSLSVTSLLLPVSAIESLPEAAKKMETADCNTIICFNDIDSAKTVELLEDQEVNILELRTVSTIDGMDYTTGYVIAEETDLKSEIEEFDEMYYNMLLESVEAFEETNPQLCKAFKTRLDNYLSSGLVISAVVIEGDLDANTKSWLKDSEYVVEVDVQTISDASAEAASLEANSLEEDFSVNSTYGFGNWLPTSGSAGVWNTTKLSNAVYMCLQWEWESESDMTYFQSTTNVTLEGDIVFYNYDGNAHVVDWYSGNWTYDTNQPNAYKDTTACDDNEVAFSIGCSDARDYEAGVSYYWVAYGDINNSSGSMAKVYFQRGYKVFQIPSQFTIFSEETEIVVPYSSWNTGTRTTVGF